MKGIKSLSSRNLAFRGYNWQLKQEINRLGASANQVLWAPEEDFNNLRIFQRPSYIALLLAQNLRLVIFEQSGFRKMIWYIRAIFLNQQTYKDSCSILERKAVAMTLFSPFLQPSMFPSLVPFFPLWNHLILYVQQWLVKNIALVGLIAPVRDYTWAEELPVRHSEWVKMSVAISGSKSANSEVSAVRW